MKSSCFSRFSAIVLAGFLFNCLHAAKVYPAARTMDVSIKLNPGDVVKLHKAKVNGKSIVQTILDFYASNPQIIEATIEWYNELKKAGTVVGVPLPRELASQFPAALADVFLTSDGCLNPDVIAVFDLVIDMIDEGVSSAKENKCKCSKSCWKSCCCNFWTKKVPAIFTLSIGPAIKIFTLVMDVMSKRAAGLDINQDALIIELTVTYY